MNEPMDPKANLKQVAEALGFCPRNKASVIATIVAKGVSLLLGILFWVLRSKAKAEGKKNKSRVFLVLSILFFVGVVTSNAQVHSDEEEEKAFDSDFEEEFQEN